MLLKGKYMDIDTLHHRIAKWLIVCAVTVVLIMMLGAATRLTGSGLSIVYITIFHGVIPPTSDTEWNDIFEQYKKTPQYETTYRKQMSLGDFKSIFWLEYLHRLVARVLAVVIFLIPFLYFLIRYYFIHKILSTKIILQIVLMFVLGGLQAIIGWIMVKSGLSPSTAHIHGDTVSVSPYRLVIHMGLAVIIYSYILWVIAKLWKNPQEEQVQADYNSLKKISLLITVILFIAIISGAFLAGIQGGTIYQSFPLMHGYLIPPDYFSPNYSFIRNFFENKTAVQFHHRVLTILSLILIIAFWCYSRRFKLSRGFRLLFNGFLGAGLIQIILGIVTLLSFIPRDLFTVYIASIHQGGGIILFTVSLLILFKLKRL